MAVAEGVEEGGGRPTAIRFPVWSQAAKRRSNGCLVNNAGHACPHGSGSLRSRSRSGSRARDVNPDTSQKFMFFIGINRRGSNLILPGTGTGTTGRRT